MKMLLADWLTVLPSGFLAFALAGLSYPVTHKKCQCFSSPVMFSLLTLIPGKQIYQAMGIAVES
jgi:hypothetical protein